VDATVEVLPSAIATFSQPRRRQKPANERSVANVPVPRAGRALSFLSGIYSGVAGEA
jgi:hypothetical protein